ncbi:MAG TPA: hypothetical protein VMD28_08335 [Acidimicrobiales bacterium]|nr:hypothetical protein [Acidimicrobiales bacterium]
MTVEEAPFHGAPARVAVVSSSWIRAPHHELAVAARSIAGAVSRLAEVDVFVAGRNPPHGDGAFDVSPIDGAAPPPVPYRAVLVEAGADEGAGIDDAAAVASLTRGARVLSLGGAAPMALDGVLDVGLERAGGAGDTAQAAPGREPTGGDVACARLVHRVGLYARVHPGAAGRRHQGLGSVRDYLLVLGDRVGEPTTSSPSDRARWLLARFPRRYVVVLEGGVARAWRSRARVAQFGVHTRMDLWLLMAQAWAVVDLLPGDVYARECVESLRYGVPVVVPLGSAAEGLAQAGGGLRFASTAQLLDCVEEIGDPATRWKLASAGHELADRWYGDPQGFVARLAVALGLPTRAPATPV